MIFWRCEQKSRQIDLEGSSTRVFLRSLAKKRRKRLRREIISKAPFLAIHLLGIFPYTSPFFPTFWQVR